MSAIRYAEANKRTLIVDWSDGQFDRKGVNAFDKCFSVKNTTYTTIDQIEHWDDLIHTSSLFKANKTEGLYDLYLEYQSPFFLKFPKTLFNFGNLSKLRRKWVPIANKGEMLFFGEDLKHNLEEDVVYYVDFLPFLNYESLPEYITLNPEIEGKLKHYSELMSIQNAIGIHIRSTDKRPTRSVQYIVDYLKKQYPNNKIYLATDSMEVEKIFCNSFGDRLLLFPKQKPELKGEGLHQWALYSNNEELKYVIYEESVIEMFLLSRCQTLFYQGNSTFSNISRVYHNDKQRCHDWQSI